MVWLVLLVLGLVIWVPAAWAQPADIEKEVADYDRQIQQKRTFLTGKEQNKKQIEEDVLKTEAALTDTQRRLQPLAAELETLKVKTQKAKKTLDAADAHPELIDPVKLEALRKDSHTAQVRQNQVEEERDKTAKQAEGLTKRLEDLKAQKQMADREVDAVNLEILNLTLKKPVTVEGIGECPMHESITAAACKETALLKAKQDAVEKGGKSLIRSLSEVSLFELKKDEIRAEANVQIRHMDILQPATKVNEGEFGKYVAKIRAVVQSLAQVGGGETAKAPGPAVTPASAGQPATPKTPAPSGKEIIGKDGAPMVLVPAGRFIMGSSNGQNGQEDDDEQPQHWVSIDAFFIDAYEVTNARYLKFVHEVGYLPPVNSRDHSFSLWSGLNFPPEIAEHPVVNVSWDDARAYCEWAGKRLPTEAEWEKAASILTRK